MKTFKEIRPEQIKKWKETKGKLKEITIPLDGEEDKNAKFVICKPTRDVLSALADAAENKDNDLAQDLLVKNCVLGGDMSFINENDKESDVSVYLAVLEEVGKFMQTPKVKSKFI